MSVQLPSELLMSAGEPLVHAHTAAHDPIAGKSCFIVMPFGIKENPVTKQKIDFDAVYHRLLKPLVVDRLKLVCTRSDEVTDAGLIHRDMVDRLLKSDVVIADITTLNANVLYELGIRHTAKRTGTVILRQKEDPVPFNINGMRVISYDFDASHPSVDPSAESYTRIIEASIRNSLIERNVDSLVHTLIPGLNVTRPARVIPTQRAFFWRRPERRDQEKNASRYFCILQGDLIWAYGVDVWVNPENTSMQMGRLHDESISSCIRYHGALRDGTGSVRRDRIADSLRRKVKPTRTVEPSTVIVTDPGRLAGTNGVKAIFHVAAQHGEPGRGYLTIRSYADCVQNVLKTMDDLNAQYLRRLRLRPQLKSVIFPLFGTRGGERDAQEVAYNIVQKAIAHFETSPASPTERVFFLAFTDADDELLVTAFNRLKLDFVGDGIVSNLGSSILNEFKG